MDRCIALLLAASLSWLSFGQPPPSTDSQRGILAGTVAPAERMVVLLQLAAGLEFPQPEMARQYAREAAALAYRSKDIQRLAEAVELVGGASTIMGDTSKAIAVLEKALDLREKVGDDRATGRCWWRLGYAYRKARRLDQAAEAFHQCIAIGSRIQDSEVQAEGLYALSDLRQDEGNYPEMMVLALRADSIYRPEEPTLTRARTLCLLGNAYLSTGALDSAYAFLSMARAMCVDLSLDYWIAWCDLHIAYVQSDRGDYGKAGQNAQLALAGFERTGSMRDLAIVNHAMAYTYWQVLPDSVVHTYFMRARHLADSLGMLRQRTTTDLAIGKFMITADSVFLHRIGILYSTRFDHAEAGMKVALRTAERISDRILMGYALNALASLENYRSAPHAAIAYHEQYLDLQRTIGDARQTASALLGLGNDHLLLGAYKKAIVHLSEALSICEAKGLNELKVYVLRDLYEANKRSEKLASALDHLERWKSLNDSLNNTGLARQLTAQELTFNFQKKQLADSLGHAQGLELEKQASRIAVEEQRTRTRAWIWGGASLLLMSGGAFVLDRKRRRERYEKRALQLEMQALRAQMNPHFLFNALTSINGLIGRQDPEAAKAFVARFAKLTRLVLENSRHVEVPLDKDLEALNLYMELEQTRSGNKFDFRIEVDPQLDPADVCVPPLVIQPLVENAIWHGVANKEGRGSIIVRVAQRGDKLIQSVEDDGVGLKVWPPEAGTEKTRTSLGTSITRSRLDLLAQQKERPASFNYVEMAQGTKIELVFPV